LGGGKWEGWDGLGEVEFEAVDVIKFGVVVVKDPGIAAAFAVVDTGETDVRELRVNFAGEGVEAEISGS
jgi:hypothetical protein